MRFAHSRLQNRAGACIAGFCFVAITLPQPARGLSFLGVDQWGIQEAMLFTVDSVTGIGSPLTRVHVPGLTRTNGVRALAMSPGGMLYGLDEATQQLLTIDTNTGNATVVGVLGDWDHQRVVSLAFSPSDVLYGYDEVRKSLLVIDQKNAANVALNVGALAGGGGIAFSPDGQLYATTWQPQRRLVVMDPVSGLIDHVVGPTSYQNATAQPTITALSFAPNGELYGVSAGAGYAPAPSVIDENLVRIDPSTGDTWAIGGLGRLGQDGFRYPGGLVVPEPGFLAALLLPWVIGTRRRLMSK